MTFIRDFSLSPCTLKVGEVVPQTFGSLDFYKPAFVIYEWPEAAQRGAHIRGFMNFLDERMDMRYMVV